jgi:hypothetical protein
MNSQLEEFTPLHPGCAILQNTDPPILSVPNELLTEIFENLLIFSDWDESTDHNDSVAFVVFSIRSVCCRFRAVVNEMNFWRAEDFQFACLLPLDEIDEIGSQGSRLRDVVDLFHDLTDDQHLVQCLAHRSMWTFSDSRMLKAVMQRIPLFRQTITDVIFDNFYEVDREGSVGKWVFIDRAIERLAGCVNLTTLEIDSRWTDVERAAVSLDVIVDSCPFLKTLKFLNAVGHNFRGTLKGMTSLESLSVWETELMDPEVSLKCMFPLQSAISLTRLSLAFENMPCVVVYPDENPYASEYLNVFVNLSELSISHLSPLICSVISRAKFHLNAFEILVHNRPPVPLSSLLAIFSAPCLLQLQELRLRLQSNMLQFPSYLQILHSIACNLHSLRDLNIAMGFNTAWCGELARLVDLQFLNLIVPSAEYCDSDDPNETPTKNDRALDSDANVVARRKLQMALGHLISKPSISLSIRDQILYDVEWFHMHSSHRFWDLASIV